jgi:hypothetical protein
LTASGEKQPPPMAMLVELAVASIRTQIEATRDGSISRSSNLESRAPSHASIPTTMEPDAPVDCTARGAPQWDEPGGLDQYGGRPVVLVRQRGRLG